MVTPALILASQSPRRRELLQQIGVPFRPLSVAVDEVPMVGEAPAQYVTRLAFTKAQAGRASVGEKDLPVLGADTVVVCDDQILEKPENEAAAYAMWRRLSGRTHEVMTAVCLLKGEQCRQELSITEVQFWPLTEAQMAAYWATGECRDKAGGYAIQGLGAVFVKRISGSYSGVVGLPIEKLVPMLDALHLPYWQTTD
ncbi:Maf family protein [Simiduia aestuariiviva]|uniref:dTTP/UTP pyrophosphatase n=1 Tax=Simiduia aestuariiviva TaxID=1510459 RepID=A0A839UUY2_9GAMM|nr:nucleoside triphosphate pyrophosphatase [Simiduia aestuariiviva]MBB3169165.1 septum formation protein [Simiduia aestuariiviva]